MAWETVTTEDVLSEFTVSEAAAIRQLQGSGSGTGRPFANIDVIVARAIDEVRGYIAAGGYEVDPILDNTLPLWLHSICIAIARWRLLIATPSFRQLQTEERRHVYDDALKTLVAIAKGEFFIEPPVEEVNPRTGNWNSENKLLMRTHPVPKPDTQLTPTDDDWANTVEEVLETISGALYDPDIVALRSDSNSLENVATTQFETSTMLIIVIDLSESSWQLVAGAADETNPDGEVAPLDYDASTNDRHWAKVGGL